MNPRTLSNRAPLIALFATIAINLVLAFTSAQATPLYTEDFSYLSGSTLVPQGGWAQTGTVVTNPITVNAPGLSYACYANSGIGNAAGPLMTSGQDVNHAFPGVTAGSAYAAFMINVVSTQTTGDYLFHFVDGLITGNIFRGRVFLKKDAVGTNFAFGLQFGSNLNAVYTGFTFTPGTTYLVVLKYSYVAGATNDVVSLFVNPVPGASEPAATLTTTDALQTDATNLDFVAIRQGTAGSAASATIDGIRVADNWADAVTASNYTITTSAGPGGTITPSGAVSVACGGSQTFTIEPADKCSAIADVLVDGVSVGAVTSYTFTDVQANHSIDASFSALGPFTITASAGPGGSITPSGAVSVACGASQTFTIEPADKCQAIADVKVDGVSVGPVATYTFSDVQANHTIDASFSALGPFTITASAGPGGSITPSGAVSVACGGSQTFAIEPGDKCHVIADVLVDGVSVGAVASYTFSDVQANHTIDASFSVLGPFTITASAGPGGSITPSGAVVVACGGSQTFTIAADPGFAIADVLVDGSSVGPVTSYTFSDVQANHTIAASFADVAPPSVTLTFPNGGENLIVGFAYDITWTASDNVGVTAIDLYVSRTGVGGTYETIALGEPNDGTYAWTVNEPGTNTDANPVYSAIFRVVAHDAAGNTAQDESDAGVSLFDVATETLVSMFEAEPLSDGIQLRWQFGRPELFAAIVVERSEQETGPWMRVALEPHSEGSVMTLIDRGVQVGRTYHYRLRGMTSGGGEATLAQLTVQAGVAIADFQLGTVGPNPTRNRVSIEYAVAREAPVTLTVVDVQGREAARLASGTLRPGRYQAVWSGELDRGGLAPTGVYFVRYQSPGKSLVRRIVMAR